MFTAGLSVDSRAYYTGATIYILEINWSDWCGFNSLRCKMDKVAVPTVCKVLNWLSTRSCKRSSGVMRHTGPTAAYRGIIVALISGGMSGLSLASREAATGLHDSMFVVGHFHVIMRIAMVVLALHVVSRLTILLLMCVLSVFMPTLSLGVCGVSRRAGVLPDCLSAIDNLCRAGIVLLLLLSGVLL